MRVKRFALSLCIPGALFPIMVWFQSFPMAHAENAPLKIACIGDSITEGAGVENPSANAYPIVLGRLLGIQYQTRNFGLSGATLLRRGDLPYSRTAQFRGATNYLPNIVTIKLGTNDSKPQNWRLRDQYAADLRWMIETFANLPSRPKVYLCLPVPAYAINFDINPSIIKNEIIPLIKQVAKEQGVAIIDLHTPLSGRPELFPDNIHPNAAGAALIAAALHSALVKP